MRLAGKTRVDANARTGLGWLLGARLLLAGLSLGLVVAIDRFEAGPGGTAIWGVYWTIIGAFMATIVSATMINDRQTTDLQRLCDLQLRTFESIGSGLLTSNELGELTSFNFEAERVAALRVVDAVSRQVGHVVIIQDVTDVVSIEQDLRQSERLAAFGEMAGRMAQEIRNPLASISGSVQVLQTSPADSARVDKDPEHDRLMGIVVREVDRLNDLTDLRALSWTSTPKSS